MAKLILDLSVIVSITSTKVRIAAKIEIASSTFSLLLAEPTEL